jgi:transposase-like protein
MALDFDLLGDPIPEGFGKRGRPVHTPTEEKRKLVMQLLAFDWSLEQIAAALSITPPTLRKHYFRELKARAEARFKVEAQLISALWAEVEVRNVSAIDKYYKRFEKHDARVPKSAQGKAPKAQPLGKKEEADRLAKTAHENSSWGQLVN